MKHLLLLLILCTLSASSIVQIKPKRLSSESDYYQEPSSENIQEAGTHLKKYTRQFYIGTGLMVAGKP